MHCTVITFVKDLTHGDSFDNMHVIISVMLAMARVFRL